MLKIIEIPTQEELDNKRQLENPIHDYLYILKYNNTFLLVDNGTEHVMNSIVNCTEEEYNTLADINKDLLYMVSKEIDESITYSLYYNGIKIIADSHRHDNKDVLDKFSEDINGGLLFDGAAIEGGAGGTTDLTEIQEQIDNLNLRTVIGEELDYGYFGMSVSQTTDITNGSSVKFDTLIEGNMDINPNTYSIKLKKGKTYNIDASIRSTSSKSIYGANNTNFVVVNITKDVEISKHIANIPVNTTGGTSPFNSSNDSVHFIYKCTEDCEIGVKISWTESLVTISRWSTLTVQEIGRTHIVDPMDVKDKHVVEYGMFGLSENQTTDIEINDFVKFDENLIGNIQNNPDEYSIKLKSNKTYLLNIYSILEVNRVSDNVSFGFTVLKGEVINSSTVLATRVPNTWRDYRVFNPVSEFILETKTDCEIAIFIRWVDNKGIKLIDSRTRLVVQEIAQPVVVEYNNYNEVSNPLTTTDISQESPVGSIIDYAGTTAPEHYLLCDGSVYNIADYPNLAEHFKNEYGNYNHFGGDGITTFAVPFIKSEYTDITPVMTSNNTPSPYVISASSIATGQNPWMAFNGTVNSNQDCWAGNVVNAWIMIDFGLKRRIKKFELVGIFNNPAYNPKDFILYGSNDGATFESIYTVTNQINWTPAQVRSYELNTIVNFKYYKLHFTAANGAPYSAISLIRFYDIANLTYIKYEPTHYAVNQYGGFESKEVYLGLYSKIGTVTLSDSISNYDYMVVETLNSNNQSNCHIQIPILNKVLLLTELSRYIAFKFPTDTTLQITGINELSLVSVKLIKGTIPSLLTGGLF